MHSEAREHGGTQSCPRLQAELWQEVVRPRGGGRVHLEQGAQVREKC